MADDDHPDSDSGASRLVALADEIAALQVLDPREPDDLVYDRHGLPTSRSDEVDHALAGDTDQPSRARTTHRSSGARMQCPCCGRCC